MALINDSSNLLTRFVLRISLLQLHRKLEGLAVAVDGQRHRIAGNVAEEHIGIGMLVIQLHPVDMGDDVAYLHPGA